MVANVFCQLNANVCCVSNGSTKYMLSLFYVARCMCLCLDVYGVLIFMNSVKCRVAHLNLNEREKEKATKCMKKKTTSTITTAKEIKLRGNNGRSKIKTELKRQRCTNNEKWMKGYKKANQEKERRRLRALACAWVLSIRYVALHPDTLGWM